MTSVLSYWDLYVAYIDKCVRDNQANDIDPHHYEMEWNHTLPQCLFGDWPIGQYLTLRQHAIASALQTLAFKKNCMFGWHKKDLPDILVELAWPYYTRMCSGTGKKNGRANVKALLDHPNTTANRIANGIRRGPESVKAMNNHPNTIKSRKESARRGNLQNSRRSSKAVSLTDTSTGKVFVFDSGSEAARVLGLDQGNISRLARGLYRQYKGYTAAYI